MSVTILGCVFCALLRGAPLQRRVFGCCPGRFSGGGGFVVMQRLFWSVSESFSRVTRWCMGRLRVPIFLLWLYLSWIVVLLGAVVCRRAARRDVLRRPLPAFPGGGSMWPCCCWLSWRWPTRRASVGMWPGCRWPAGGHGEIQELLEMLEVAGIVARREQEDGCLPGLRRMFRRRRSAGCLAGTAWIQSQPVTTSTGAAVGRCLLARVLAALDVGVRHICDAGSQRRRGDRAGSERVGSISYWNSSTAGVWMSRAEKPPLGDIEALDVGNKHEAPGRIGARWRQDRLLAPQGRHGRSTSAGRMGVIARPRKPTETGLAALPMTCRPSLDLFGRFGTNPAHDAQRPGFLLLRRDGNGDARSQIIWPSRSPASRHSRSAFVNDHPFEA